MKYFCVVIFVVIPLLPDCLMSAAAGGLWGPRDMSASITGREVIKKVGVFFKGCRPLVPPNPNVVINCTKLTKKVVEVLDCNVKVPTGTKATFKCKPGFVNADKYKTVFCNSRKWNKPVINCKEPVIKNTTVSTTESTTEVSTESSTEPITSPDTDSVTEATTNIPSFTETTTNSRENSNSSLYNTTTTAVPPMTPAIPTMTPAVPTMTPAVPTMTPAVPTMTPAVPTMTPAVPIMTSAVPTMTPAVPTTTTILNTTTQAVNTTTKAASATTTAASTQVVPATTTAAATQAVPATTTAASTQAVPATTTAATTQAVPATTTTATTTTKPGLTTTTTASTTTATVATTTTTVPTTTTTVPTTTTTVPTTTTTLATTTTTLPTTTTLATSSTVAAVGYITLGTLSHTYKAQTAELCWTDAEDVCKLDGGHIVIFDSNYELDMVVDYATAQAWDIIHIGYNDIQTEGTFLTNLGLTPVYPSNLVWADGQPDNYDNQDCNYLTVATKEMTDSFCSTKRLRNFICEKP